VVSGVLQALAIPFTILARLERAPSDAIPARETAAPEGRPAA
jgi:hypothetical protein